MVNIEILLGLKLAVNKKRPLKSRVITFTGSRLGKGEPGTGVRIPVTSFRVKTATLLGLAGLAENTNGCWSCARVVMEQMDRPISNAKARSQSKYPKSPTWGAASGRGGNTIFVAMSLPWPEVMRPFVSSDTATPTILYYSH